MRYAESWVRVRGREEFLILLNKAIFEEMNGDESYYESLISWECY